MTGLKICTSGLIAALNGCDRPHRMPERHGDQCRQMNQ